MTASSLPLKGHIPEPYDGCSSPSFSVSSDHGRWK